MTAPEFHRPQRIDLIGDGAREISIEATAEEAAALADRFGLIAVSALSARFSIQREGEAILAHGTVTAQIIQACCATAAPIPVRIAEPVALRFVPDDAPEDDEIELTADALDIIPYAGGAIDLGEAAAETMALAIDPFLRSPDADAILREAGVLREDEAGPFGALVGLKAQLEGNKGE